MAGKALPSASPAEMSDLLSCRNSSVNRQKSGRPWRGTGTLVPSSGLHVFRIFENGQATSSCPRGVTRTMKNGGQVELLTPASAQLILIIPQGTLAMAFLCGSPMALGFPNTSWSTNENRAGSHYFSVFWKAVQFGLGGQSRCSVSASDTHGTHAQDQRASTGFPRTRLCVCLCVSGGGATERSFPFPDPLNVPRGAYGTHRV